MTESEDPMAFTPLDRPIRAGIIGLGRIYDLNRLAYVDNDEVDVVALVDANPARRVRCQRD